MQKEAKRVHLITRIIVLAVIAFLIAFFFQDVYHPNFLVTILITLISITVFAAAWNNNLFTFFLVAFASIITYLSLEISFNAHFFIFTLASFAVAGLCWWYYDASKYEDKYALMLAILFVFIFIILAFNVKYLDDWKLENYLTVPFVIAIVVLHRWFKFSKVSYTLIFLFMVLHVIGSHYTYAEVPFGYWLANFFGLERNHYDRIVHFGFGFLLGYPIREMFIRVGKAKGIWAFWLPIELVFGLSAIYELIEWGAAVMYGGDLGIAYLGTQGDVWDAQKDMFNAGIGAILAMLIVVIILFAKQGKDYWQEIKHSFKIDKQVLGEEALKRMDKKP